MESAVFDEKSDNLTENDEEKIEAPPLERLEPKNSTLEVPEPKPQNLGTLDPENQQLSTLEPENQRLGTSEIENQHLDNLQAENQHLGNLQPDSPNSPSKVLRSKKSRRGDLEIENELLSSSNQLAETKPQNIKSENEPFETLGAENQPFKGLKFEMRPSEPQNEPLGSLETENLASEVPKSENESLSTLGVNIQPLEAPKFELGSPKRENLESQTQPSEVLKPEIQADEPSEKENDLTLQDAPKNVEQNPKTLLDKEKIKKRLQAFSLMKQGLSLSPIKKFGNINKTVTQFSGEVQYDENGEKLNEKIVIKKPSKKSQKSHDEIAKSTIDEIEELKKVEKHFYSNPFITPGIPMKSVALDSDQNIDREWDRNRDRERDRDKDYNRSRRRSKKSQKHRDYKEKPRKRRNSDSFEIKMPQNWKNCKDQKMAFHQIRKVKEKTIIDRKRDRDKNLSRPIDIFDSPSSQRNFYVVNSSKDEKETKKFPMEIIKFTEKHPKITYCENPQVAKPAFPNRKQILNIVPKERVEILKAFFNNKIRHLEPVAVIVSARNWFPKEKYLTESELVYEKPEISYGLSVLTQNYFDEMDYEIQDPKSEIPNEKIDSENTNNSEKCVKDLPDQKAEISDKNYENDKKVTRNEPDLDLEQESLTPKIKPNDSKMSENESCDSTPDTNDYRSNWESDEDLIDEIMAENQFGTPQKSPKRDKKPPKNENETPSSKKDGKISIGDQKSIEPQDKIEKSPNLAETNKKMEIGSPKSTHQKSDLKGSQSLEKSIESPQKSSKSEKIEGSLKKLDKNRNRNSSPNYDREEKSRSRRDSAGEKNHRNRSRSRTPDKPLRHQNRSKSPKNRSCSPKKQRGSPKKFQESNKSRSGKSWSPKRSENRSKSPKNRSGTPKNRGTPRKRSDSHENRGFPKNRSERHENPSKGTIHPKDTKRSKSREKYSTKENREKLSTSRESLSKSRKNRSKSSERRSYDRKRSKSHDIDKKRSKSREKIDRPRSKAEKHDRASQNREKTPKNEKRGRKDSECLTETSKPSKREKYLLEHLKPGDISYKRENFIDTNINEISTNLLTNRESKMHENLTDKLDRIIRSKEKSSWSSDDEDFSSKPKISEQTDDSESSNRKKSKKHSTKKAIKNQVIIDYNDYEKYIDDSIIVEEKSQPIRHKIKIDYSDFDAVLEKPVPKIEKDNFSDSHTPEIYSDNTFTPDRFRSQIYSQIEKLEIENKTTPSKEISLDIQEKSLSRRDKFSPLRDKSLTVREKSPSLRGKSPPLRTKSPPLRSKSPPLREKSPTPRDKTPPLRAVTPPTREGRNKTPPRKEDRSTVKSTLRNETTNDFSKQLTPPLKIQKRQTTPLRELRATPTKGSELPEGPWTPTKPSEPLKSPTFQSRPFINFSNEKNLSTGLSFTLGPSLEGQKQISGGDIAPKGDIQLAKPLGGVSPIPPPIGDGALLGSTVNKLTIRDGPIGIEASTRLNRLDTFGGTKLATPFGVGEGLKALPPMTELQIGGTENKVGSESCDPSKLVSEYEEFMKAVSFDSTEIFDEEQINKSKTGKVENEKIGQKKDKGGDDDNENQISFKFDKKRKIEKSEKQRKKRRKSNSSSDESSESSSDSSSSNSSDSSDSSSSDSTDTSDSESETSSDSEISETEPEIITIKQEKLSDTEMDKNVPKNIVIKKEKFDMFEEMQNKLLNDSPKNVTNEKQIFNLDEIQLPTQEKVTTEKTPKMFIPTKILTKTKPQKPEYQPTEPPLNSPALTEITTTSILNSPKIDLSIRKRPSNILNISPIKKMLMEDSDSDQDFTDKFKKHNDTLSLPQRGIPKNKGGIPTELPTFPKEPRDTESTEIISKASEGLEDTKEGSNETMEPLGAPLGPNMNKPLGIYKLSTEGDTKEVPLMQTTLARGGFKEATLLEGVPTNIGIYKLAPIPVQREATAVEEPPKKTETEIKISEKEKELPKENMVTEDRGAKKDSKRRSEKRDRDSRDRDYRSERSRDRKRSSRDRRRSYSRERERSKTSRDSRETRDSRKTRDYDRRRSSKRYSRSPTPKRDKKIHRSPPRSKHDSPNSEFLGFKKSLADSTISDSELSIRKNYYDDHLNDGSPYQRLPTPDSPKRISLDDRINQVLGIEKPKPIESVCNRNQPADYENYHGNYHDNYYHNYHHHDQYNMHYQQGNYQHDYQHHQQGYQHDPHNQNQNQNHNHQQQQQKTKVLQVGNVIQVVPTENIQNISPAPIVPTANVHEMPPKVVQVGNVLQIVPISTLPAVETKITEPDTSEPPSAEMPEVVSNTPNLVPVPIVDPPIEKTISISEKLILKEKRKHERELRRQEKEKKRLEKQKRKQIKMKLRTENMIKKALLLETTEMQEAEEEEKIELTGESRITSLPWPPTTILNLNKTPSKGILVTPGFSSKQVSLIDGELTTDTKKVVKFADGICPGEGTSPSGGEDLPSPPPPTRKKIKSKKKVKVKIIRTQQPIVAEESDEEDNLPPPPPPPGSPPPHLWPPRVKTAPQIPNQVPIQQMYPNPFPPQTPPGVLGYPPAFTSHHPIRHHMPVMPVHGAPPMGPQHLGPPQFHPHRSHPD